MSVARLRPKAAGRPERPADPAPPRPTAVIIPLREDQAFLPADLEILETPPSPVRMALILLIASFVVLALVWSWFGQIEIIAIAHGKIQPTGRVKVIQPLEAGKVAAIHVENGQAVHAGDVLIEMERGDAAAEAAGAAAALGAYRAEALRRRTAIEAAARAPIAVAATIPWPDDIPAGNRRREDQVLAADLAQLAAAVASLDAQIAQKEIERDRLGETMTAEADLIATLTERVSMRQALIPSASGSRASVIDSLEALQTQRTVLTTQKSQVAAAVASLAVLARERDKLITTFLADNGQKRAEAERQVDDVEQRLAKADLRLDRMRLVAPIDGTVLGMTVTTVGQVLTGGEEVMRVVPDDVTLEIESYLPNKDIGFVKPGQTAVVKVESFPFTRYGTVPATITRVAHDALPEPDAQQTEQTGAASARSQLFAGAQHTQNLVFPVTLSLTRTTMSIDGAAVALKPGMSVDVEIATGHRRILDYFLAPLAEVTSEAIKER